MVNGLKPEQIATLLNLNLEKVSNYIKEFKSSKRRPNPNFLKICERTTESHPIYLLNVH